jgi:hypothetical protein
MTTPLDISKVAQEQILTAIKQTQDIALAGVELWAKNTAPLAAKGQQVATELPTPEQLVANSFGFAEKLLATQKEFAKQVVAAWASVAEETKAPAGK